MIIWDLGFARAVQVVLSQWLPEGGDEYQRLCGKLFVGLTLLPTLGEALLGHAPRFVLVSSFASNEDLKNVLHGSMHIPFYMSHTARVRGRLAMDGGFFQNMARLDRATVRAGVGWGVCVEGGADAVRCACRCWRRGCSVVYRSLPSISLRSDAMSRLRAAATTSAGCARRR